MVTTPFYWVLAPRRPSARGFPHTSVVMGCRWVPCSTQSWSGAPVCTLCLGPTTCPHGAGEGRAHTGHRDTCMPWSCGPEGMSRESRTEERVEVSVIWAWAAGLIHASSGSMSLSLGRERRWGPSIGCPGRAAAPLAGRLGCRRAGVPGLSFPASGGTASPSTALRSLSAPCTRGL